MTTTVETAVATGRVARVIGPVVDVEFPVDAMPEIYNALHVEVADPAKDGEKKTLTLEVAQHLGDGLVRTISMQPTDGLVRQAAVTDTGTGITVPVGDFTKGKVFNTLGEVLNTDETYDGERWRSTARRRTSTSSSRRPRCSRPASRSSTFSPRTSRVERSVCSVVPASARRCSSRR